jgi:hypothetical protein
VSLVCQGMISLCVSCMSSEGLVVCLFYVKCEFSCVSCMSSEGLVVCLLYVK